MVMHARKPQRVGDGYFDKHQTHPYQKYNSKGERRVGGDYGSEYSSPLRSPNGNVASHSHSHGSHHHHYSHSSDDRGYSRSYQKGAEKERDRDYKSSRDKYADGVRSPKDKRSKDSDRERSNHERSETDAKKSRATSNSVNSASRSSKFDKRAAPAPSSSAAGEWSEHISSSGKKYYYNCVSEVSQWERPREWDNRRSERTSKETASNYTSRNNHEKRTSHTDKAKRSGGQYWNNSRQETDGHADRSRSSKHVVATHEQDGQTQDMDISPGNSTPLSEHSYKASRPPPVVVIDHSTQQRPQSVTRLAGALPRLASNPPHQSAPAANNGALVSPEPSEKGAPAAAAGTPCRDAGPPTPTHSETDDPRPPLVETALPRKMESVGSYPSVVSIKSSLYPMPQHAPPLTPSLVNHVRADLTGHVTAWPADILEKQAHKYTEDAYVLGCLQTSRVCSELKCARSLVRHTEIQATLQEQKLMYLRTQITRMEELKSQNTFMADTS